MATFATYLSLAQRTGFDGKEQPSRSQWSDAQMRGGIMRSAMEGLAAMLDPEFAPAIHESADGVLSVSRFIIYRDARFHVLGLAGETPLMPLLLREAQDKARETITLCILPRPDLELVTLRKPTSIDVRTGVFAVYPSDVEALASREVTIEQLLEYKLFRRLIAERPDSETQFIDRLFLEYGCGQPNRQNFLAPLDNAITARAETESDWVEHPLLAQVDATAERHRHSLLFGYSSSGKSVLAFQVGRRREAAGWRVGYLNLSDEVAWPAGLVQNFLFGDSIETPKWIRNPSSQLVIADDLQSRPPVARLLLGVASLAHRVRDRARPVILGVSWKEFAREAAQFCPDAAPVPIHAKLVRDELLEKYARQIDPDAVNTIAQEIGDDLYLLRLALGVTARQKSAASKADVAEDIWQQRVPNDGHELLPSAARRVALLTAAIGQFDIHLPLDFLQQTARVDTRLLTQLMDSRLLRRVGDRVTLGHRSLCALIAWWLNESGAWRDLGEVGGPRDLTSAVLVYLKASGTTAMADALRALVARAGFKDREDLSQRAVALMDVWRVFDAVVERVERQQAADATWGSTPSSAVFVTTLLSEIGKPELATPSLDFLRSHWRESNGRLEIDTSGLSTLVDFEIIKKRMLDEDVKNTPPKDCESALEIDIDRFHKTWLAGLILGAESVAAAPTIPRDRLAALVEREQVKATGAFYPHRVPWCTARVILGLAACGRSIENSSVVKWAIDWLLRDRHSGGARENGYWRSGTGDWNTAVEATALVILAAVKSGVDPADTRLLDGRKYLLAEREKWAGLDGAVAVEALLVSGSKWQDLANDTARLSQRALDQSLWLQATLGADQTLKQTCQVAQAATHLIDIGWTAIRSDLGGLLEAIDLSGESPELTPTRDKSDKSQSIATPASALQAPVTATTVDDAGDIVAKLDDLRFSRFSVVGSYLRFHEKVRTHLRNQYIAIRRALDTKSQERENYLIWAPPGSGKTSFVIEIANVMGNDFAKEQFCLLNLSELPHNRMVDELRIIQHKAARPLLCMIDEIDSRSSEAWPYEEVFTCLDWNTRENRHIVFVLAGSGGNGLNGMIGGIRNRPRGADLIDRIPESRRFEIPGSDNEDRLIIFAKQALLAADARHQEVREIERLVLYYVLKSELLSTPRQLTEFAKAAVGRMERADSQLLYDHIFRVGDRRRMEFWVQNLEYATRLQSTFVWVSE